MQASVCVYFKLIKALASLGDKILILKDSSDLLER